jgi:hypothetical protein
MQKVMEEAEKSSLFDDPKFLEAAAMAFHVLGESEECIRILDEALRRGVRLRLETLTKALDVADSTGITTSTNEIRMLVANAPRGV